MAAKITSFFTHTEGRPLPIRWTPTMTTVTVETVL